MPEKDIHIEMQDLIEEARKQMAYARISLGQLYKLSQPLASSIGQIVAEHSINVADSLNDLDRALLSVAHEIDRMMGADSVTFTQLLRKGEEG